MGFWGNINLDSYGTDIYIWGAQLESQSYLSTISPPMAQQLQDKLILLVESGNSEVFNDSEGVLFADISALADDLTTRFISISNGSTSNRVYLGYNTATNRIQGTVFSEGALACAFNASSSDVTLFSKIAIKYKQNDFALWINGLEVDTDTSGSTPSNLNTLRFDASQVTTDFYGKTKEIAYYNTVLTDAELEYLTSYRSLSELVTELNLNTL